MSSDTEVELTAQQKWTKMTKDDPPWHYRRAKKLDKAAYCKPGVDIKRPLSAFEEGVDYFSDREDAIHAWEANQAASHKKRKRQHSSPPTPCCELVYVLRLECGLAIDLIKLGLRCC